MTSEIVKNRNYLYGYLLFWLIIFGGQFVLLFRQFNLPLQTSILDSAVFNLIYMLLGIMLWFPAKFISLEKTSVIQIVINHLSAAVISSLGWVFVSKYVAEQINGSVIYQKFLDESLSWRIILGVFYYAVIVAVNYSRIYYKSLSEKLIHESELKKLVKESELRTLKYQINPHFIFNSLNSIASLTQSDSQAAQKMTLKLSDYLRSTLSANESDTIPFSEECRNIKNYLEIEKIRFNDRFDFVENFNKDCSGVKVPNMILQPLVENAIKYGVYESIEKVIISLDCIIENNYLKISIRNNFDPSSGARSGEGIGLKNVNNRLKLSYGIDDLLKTQIDNSEFCATIYIPLEQNRREQNI